MRRPSRAQAQRPPAAGSDPPIGRFAISNLPFSIQAHRWQQRRCSPLVKPGPHLFNLSSLILRISFVVVTTPLVIRSAVIRS